MRFETTYKSPGKRRRMCLEEQARPRAALHRPGSRASPASMSKRTRLPRPIVAHWTGMPPSLLELGRQVTQTPSPPSPGSIGSRQGTWALRAPPSSTATGSRQSTSGQAGTCPSSRRIGSSSDGHHHLLEGRAM